MIRKSNGIKANCVCPLCFGSSGLCAVHLCHFNWLYPLRWRLVRYPNQTRNGKTVSTLSITLQCLLQDSIMVYVLYISVTFYSSSHINVLWQGNKIPERPLRGTNMYFFIEQAKQDARSTAAAVWGIEAKLVLQHWTDPFVSSKTLCKLSGW